jgi:CHAT domain-containing protein/predicted negative regulator of RcsB-dependent stress response
MDMYSGSLRVVTATLLLSLLMPLLPQAGLPQSIAQAQTPQELADRAQLLYREGVQLLSEDRLSEALEKFTQVYNILVPLGDRGGVALVFNRMGSIYLRQGQFPWALSVYEQALTQIRETDDRAGESRILNNIGLAHYNLGNYDQALDAYQQALAIYQQLGDQEGTGITLTNVGAAYLSQGEVDRALAAFQEALTIYQQNETAAPAGSRATVAAILNNMGEAYRSRSQFAAALDQFQQALTIYQELGDDRGTSATLNNIAAVNVALGQYSEALQYYQQALTLASGDYAGTATIRTGMGEVYRQLGDYQQALEAYQDALAASRAIQDRAGERAALNNIGEVYREFNQPAEALTFYQQALELAKSLNNRAGEGVALSNIGSAYAGQGDQTQAMAAYQQALAIQTEIGDRAGAGVTLNNIGLLLAQDQPELAIVFLKESVNLREAIREELAVLPQDQQDSYAQTVEGTYRSLADLLLQADRVLEAQQVLDLLKVQEIDSYLRDVDRPDQAPIEPLPAEAEILTNFEQVQDQAVQMGRELARLRNIPAAQRTSEQEQRLAELVEQQRLLTQQFTEFTRRPEIVSYTEQLSRTAQQQNVDLVRLRQISGNLRQLGQNAVLLYPLVLEDRLELVLATADSPPIRRTVPIGREALNARILEFRRALTTPRADATASARQLYDLLIRPIENDLAQAGAETILYAPDGQLRYIPLAALNDGQQWLIERFRVNLITADSLTNLNTRPQPQLRVLAGAFSTENLTVDIGDRKFDFAGLPFARREVENLAATVPDTTELLEQQFNRDATLPYLDEYSVIHFATHATFQVGEPEESFIVFGDGSVITLAEIQDSWFLTNVDLIVLSACQTGLGGQFGDGEEILGFGYLMQNAGARAALATLWSVDDGGTQALMNAFYAALQTGTVTKAEALQQAQTALIQINSTHVIDPAVRSAIDTIRTDSAPETIDRLSHPFYWAPFILIGNGL